MRPCGVPLGDFGGQQVWGQGKYIVTGGMAVWELTAELFRAWNERWGFF